MLTVHPELQDQGLGSQLLQEGEAYAQFWDCKSIHMRVISLRTELIAWYERKGYKKTGETAAFEKNNPRLGIPKMDFEFVILKKPVLL
jgi:ribosomal protein S18 acetylase RimI-like enzyme